MNEKQISQFAKMQSDLSHLTRSFDEFKLDIKEGNRKIDEKIDSIVASWNDMSSTIRSLLDIQRQVNEHENWINNNKHFIEEEQENKRDTRKRLKSIAFKYGVEIVLVLVAGYFFIESQNKNSFSSLVEVLESGLIIEQYVEDKSK